VTGREGKINEERMDGEGEGGLHHSLTHSLKPVNQLINQQISHLDCLTVRDWVSWEVSA
jgi:hypothetical protein